ncbi:hypothetical protein [Gilliamella sp. Pas-s25]|uniref:hypothetical protein n=1 Tax=Gilliamella sp. Pas-s25 TaxID=2687310 RepID=UPI00135E7B22|nr:hypothetical protein [Gilliamella sp. Pas-s25]MWP61704.1 hypothetical protein [Gilliamella sp. Pas-s25]
MNLFCDNCNKAFIASEEQDRFILVSREKNMKFIMIQCPYCSMSYAFNPMQLTNLDNKKIPVVNGLRCPKEICTGIVSYIEDIPPFFGCGECGNVWLKKENLYDDIKNIISKYPYRKHAYNIINGEYLPVLDKEIPSCYDEQVSLEWNDQINQNDGCDDCRK